MLAPSSAPPPRPWWPLHGTASPSLSTPSSFPTQPLPAVDRAPIPIVDRDVDRNLDEFFEFRREKQTWTVFFSFERNFHDQDADFLVVQFCIPWLFLLSSVFFPPLGLVYIKRILWDSLTQCAKTIFWILSAKTRKTDEGKQSTSKKNKQRDFDEKNSKEHFKMEKESRKEIKRRRGSVKKTTGTKSGLWFVVEREVWN